MRMKEGCFAVLMTGFCLLQAGIVADPLENLATIGKFFKEIFLHTMLYIYLRLPHTHTY